MQVLLIAPPIMDRVDGRLRAVGVDAIRECPPLGIYALAAVLEGAGHGVEIADLIVPGTQRIDHIAGAVDTADLVGIGATSMAWPTAVDVIRQLRMRRPDVPIVCGGIHPTLFDRHVLASYPVQFVVRGEGETAIIALCEALEGRRGLDNVPNLSWMDGDGRLVRNPIAAKLDRHTMGRLPLPAYSRLAEGAYKCIGIESSRGCGYDCSFCSTPYRRSWRGLEVDEVMLRLEHALAHLDRTTSRCIHIVDDEFAMHPKRAQAIATGIDAAGLKPRLLFDARAQDLLHDALVPRIAPYTAGLLVGAECGYDEGLQRIGKGTTCETLERAAGVLRDNGIADRADFSFILGLPWEDKAEVTRTVRFATHLFATYGVHVVMQWYRQIPGSRIWDEARRAEQVHESMYDEYGFFRDLYLFRTSCRLTPSEIYDIADMADQLRWLSSLPGRERPAIVHHFPTPIAQGFPRALLDPRRDGLANLRAIARPPTLQLQGEQK